jgi:hypothetical protein
LTKNLPPGLFGRPESGNLSPISANPPSVMAQTGLYFMSLKRSW